MCQSMILIISLLMKSLSTKLTHPGPVTLVDPHVGVQCGASVEGFTTSVAFVWLVIGVDDFVAAKSGGLTKAFATYLTYEGAST